MKLLPFFLVAAFLALVVGCARQEEPEGRAPQPAPAPQPASDVPLRSSDDRAVVSLPSGVIPRYTAVAFLPDGKRAIAATGGGCGMGGLAEYGYEMRSGRSLVLWDVSTGKVLRRYQEPPDEKRGACQILCLSLSRDGKRVVAGDDDGTVSLLEVETGRLVNKVVLGVGMRVNTVAISPDGSTVVASDSMLLPPDDPDAMQSRAFVWDVRKEKASREVQVETGALVFLAFSPNGKRALAVGNRQIVLFDPSSGKVERKIGDKEEHYGPYSISADGRYLLANSALWDLENGMLVTRLPDEAPQASCLTPDGSHILTGSDHRLKLWEVASAKARLEFKSVDRPEYRKGHRRQAGQPDRREEKTKKETWNWQDAMQVQCLAISPDGRQALCGRDPLTLILWDMGTGKEIRTMLLEGVPKRDRVPDPPPLKDRKDFKD